MIFIDRSIPKSVAEALKLVRNDVRWLEDDYAPDTKDAEWLAGIGARGWLLVCRDKHIRTRPGERGAIRDNRIGCFILNQKRNPTRWEYLKLLCATLDEMEQRFAETRRPFIYTVDSRGVFRQVLSEDARRN